jgi:5'-AMP-activated protein kinase regulatory gamma subunit
LRLSVDSEGQFSSPSLPLFALLEIERSIGVPPPPLLSVHPLHPLFEAAKLLQKTHARRLPLIDKDEQSGGEVVLSVLTQYRVLKFIAVNVSVA